MSGKYNEFANLSNKQKRRRLSTIIREQTFSENNSDSDSEENLGFPIPPIRPPFETCEFQSEDLQHFSNQSSDSTISSNHNDNEIESMDDISDIEIEGENLSESDVSEDDIVMQQINDPHGLAKRILKNAFLAAGLKHSQGNLLLKTLREFPFSLNYLPKDSRTLLDTPTTVASRQIQMIPGGEYLHIGFRRTLMQKLKNLTENELPDKIVIDLSTDGAKIDKGLFQYWPIQYRINNITDKRVVIAGIYKGKHKPSNPFDFFNPVVQEIVEMQEGGVLVNHRLIPLEVRSFIADAPARAFILNHYSHNSFYPCSKCKVEGEHCVVPGFESVMVFLGTEHTLRTDEDYSNLVDDDHQKGESPLAPILPLVSQVPFEPMHLVWIGIAKKIVSSLVEGQFGFQRLSGRKINIMNSRMLQIAQYCPSEFNRRPKEISLHKHFKATEYRQLTLYTSPSVFKNILLQEFYDHFMLLNCTMRLLGSENVLPEIHDFCKQALKSFVRLCERLYGPQFLPYNVHGILHCYDDVLNLGPYADASSIRNSKSKTLYLQQVFETVVAFSKI